MVPAIKTILVPTDFSPTSEHALEYGVALAQQTGATLHLLHVVSYPVEVSGWPDAYWAGMAGLRQQLLDDAELKIGRLAGSIQGVKVATEVLEGSPARTVVSAAQNQHCQIIVMGTHGRGGFSHLVLGSVAERVVRTASCPVLTVSTATAEAKAPGAKQSTD